MSEQSQGPNWWQASDGRWYPPELHPDYVAPPSSPPPAAPPPAAPPPTAPGPSVQPDHSPGPPGDGRGSQAPNRSLAIIAGGVVAVGALIAVLLLTLGGGDDTVAIDAVDRATEAPQATAEPQTSTAPPTAAPAPTEQPEADPDPTASPAEPTPTPEPTPTTEPTPADAPDPDPSGLLGTPENPAALGTVFVFEEDFTATVVSVDLAEDTDALDEDADPPPPGDSYVIVISEFSYWGPDTLVYVPNTTRAEVGGTEYDPWDNDCDLDYVGSEINYEASSGQTVRNTECFQVPTEDLAQLQLVLDDYRDTRHFSATATATQPDPDVEQAAAPTGPGTLAEPLPQDAVHDFEEYRVKVTRVFDPEAADELESWSDTPEGQRAIAVTIDVDYLGSGNDEFMPVEALLIGDRVHHSFDSTCVLNRDLYEYPKYEVSEGESFTNTVCFNVPEDELERTTLVIRGDYEDPVIAFDAGL